MHITMASLHKPKGHEAPDRRPHAEAAPADATPAAATDGAVTAQTNTAPTRDAAPEQPAPQAAPAPAARNQTTPAQEPVATGE
jgi:hypothetical protein